MAFTTNAQKGLLLAIIILSAVHVFISLVMMVVCARMKSQERFRHSMYTFKFHTQLGERQSLMWFISLCINIAILVLSSIEYSKLNDE